MDILIGGVDLLELLKKLGGIPGAQEVISGVKEVVRVGLIEPLGNTLIHKTARRRLKITELTEKRISLSQNFLDWFCTSQGGVVRYPVPKKVAFTGEYRVFHGKLKKRSGGKLIFEWLGGLDKSAITLSDLFSLIFGQAKGEKPYEGAFLEVDRTHNIAFIPQKVTRISATRFSFFNSRRKKVEEETDQDFLLDKEGNTYVVRVVAVYWSERGWTIDALPIVYRSGEASWIEVDFQFPVGSKIIYRDGPI